MIIATTHLDRSPDVCGCTGNKNIYVKTIYFHTEKWDNEVFTKCRQQLLYIYMWEYIAMSSQLFFDCKPYIIHLHYHRPFTSLLERQQCWGKSWKKKVWNHLMYDNMRKGEKALNAYLFLSLKQNAQGSIKDFQCHRSIPINWLKIVKYQLWKQDCILWKNFSINFYYTVKYSVKMKRESLNLNIMNHNPDNFRITKWQDCGQKLKFFPNIDPILLHLSLVSYQKKGINKGFALKITASEKKVCHLSTTLSICLRNIQ